MAYTIKDIAKDTGLLAYLCLLFTVYISIYCYYLTIYRLNILFSACSFFVFDNL